MTEPIVFRQSEITGFRNCRRNWALNYRAGYTRKRYRPSTAGAGTLFHRGAEVYYKGGSLSEALTAVRELWTADLPKIEDGYEDAYQKQLDLALIMVKGYIEWVQETGIDVGLTITGAEVTLSVQWPGMEDIILTGKLDLDAVDELGALVMIDFKSRASVEPTPGDLMDAQRRTYALLKYLLTGQLYAALSHRYVKRVKRTGTAKPPFFAEHQVHITREELVRHAEVLNAQLHEMVPLARGLALGTIALDDPRLYPNVTNDCSWKCPFLDVCPMMDDGGDWEWALNAFFDKADPSKLGDGEETD